MVFFDTFGETFLELNLKSLYFQSVSFDCVITL